MSVSRRPIANRHEIRHRGRQPAAGRACRSTDPGARWQRGRRGDRDQCGDGPGRATVQRNWRRPLRDRLPGADRRTPRAQRGRLGAGGTDAGASQGARAHINAAGRHPHGDRTGRRRRLGWIAGEARLAPLLRSPGARDHLRGRGLPGFGRDRRALGRAHQQAGLRAIRRGPLSAERPRAARRRGVQESWARGVPPPHRRARPGRLLRRAHR